MLSLSFTPLVPWSVLAGFGVLAVILAVVAVLARGRTALLRAVALGRNGEPLYPVSGGDQRQREMAFRGGINVVIYTLTGNYKADQVHVPALLERLGQ